jgi:hypothetical protein
MHFSSFDNLAADDEVRGRLDLGECLLLRGGHYMPDPSDAGYDARLRLQAIFVGQREVVYLIRALLPETPGTAPD